MEYLFSKDELQKLITDSPDQNTIVISVDYRFGPTDNEFLAVITATARTIAANATTQEMDPAVLTVVVNGCPSPPGCR